MSNALTVKRAGTSVQAKHYGSLLEIYLNVVEFDMQNKTVGAAQSISKAVRHHEDALVCSFNLELNYDYST